jgi:hypothetical protein
MKRFPFLLSVLLVCAAGLRADEIRLKDGSKIVGTIVEFENDSFKVQTAYGFAMVRKDSIAQIVPSDTNKSAEPAKPVTAAAPAATVKPASAVAAAPAATADSQLAISQGATSSPVAATAVAPARAVAASALAMPAPNPRPAPTAPLAAIPSAEPPPVAAAPIPAVPLPIRETVQGTVYTNETYGFELYRPPGWGLMLEARKALPNAITAMGTSDETTLFVIGREAVRDSLEAQAANSERALQKVYENYRHVSTEKRTVGGLPAVQWRFRGLADGHDWSVTVLTIARGGDVFTLLGMTYADSDLIQIRENVIAKMIASLQFGAPR